METLVVSQHRNQYYGKVRSHGQAQFGSSPFRNFREINCRTFQSGVGILPPPCNYDVNSVSMQPALFSSTGSNSDNGDSTYSSRTPGRGAKSHSDDVKELMTTGRSSPIPINGKGSKSERPLRGKIRGDFGDSFSFSERWAGPAYSNSPPPSSLPIPKFSLRAKRTVSLDLPASDPVIDMHPIAKSAPASPTREHELSSVKLFLSADSATKTLRRILNLDIADD